MSSVILTGDTSGTLTVSAPLVAGSNTLTLAAATGTLSPLVSATAQASTSGTSIDFTGIPSYAKRITVMFDGVSSSGTSLWLLQLGDSGGVETSGYLGSSGRSGSSTAASSATNAAGATLLNSVAAASTYCGSIKVELLNGTTWVINGLVGDMASGNPTMYYSAVSKTLSAALDRIRITTVNGTDTFDAGSINIMYEG